MEELQPTQKVLSFNTYGSYCAKNFGTVEICRFVYLTSYGQKAKCLLYGNILLEQDRANGFLIRRCRDCIKEFK